MEFPEDLKYTDSDEWVRVEGEQVTIGITDYAQDALSDIVYFEATVTEGESVAKGDSVGAVESVKAASDIYSAISGEVLATNDLLTDTPELINSAPYGDGWMLKLKLKDTGELEGLMEAPDYQKYCEEREH
jgi:glycine cleavage system H protein